MEATWVKMKIKAPEFKVKGTSTEVACPSCFWRIFDKDSFGDLFHEDQKRWIVITERFGRPFMMAPMGSEFIKSFCTEEEAKEYVKKSYDAEFERWLE